MSRLQILPVIDGKAYEVSSGDTVDVINPATGEIIGQQACCTNPDSLC
jgi:acyl-CoA reductase-like NAD-dependent aldehyde dehydrogenase